jgi:hypothetical protein
MEFDAGARVSTGGGGELGLVSRERRGGLGSSVWVRGREGGPGCLNRHEKGGEAASRRPWPSMAAALIGIKGGRCFLCTTFVDEANIE